VWLIPILIWGCAASSGGRTTPTPVSARTGAAITPADLQTRISIYADDSMQGRLAGTPGSERAVRYIEREVRRLGLEPAGDAGSYFQNVPMVQRMVDSASTLVVAGQPLTLWREFAPFPYYPMFLPYGPSFQGDGVPAIYGGRYGEGPPLNPDASEGKVVVYSAPLDSTGRPDWRLFRYGPPPTPPGALAVAFATLDLTPEEGIEEVKKPKLALSASNSDPSDKPMALFLTPAAAATIFGSPLERVKPGTVGKPLSGKIGFAEQRSPAPVQNVVAILRGSDPWLRLEYVAIGAHSDHIGTVSPPLEHDSVLVFNHMFRQLGGENPAPGLTRDQEAAFRAALDSISRMHPRRADSVANGADDDGSGSMALLEIAEALAAHPARRSILFVWHTAEEEGLFGSQWFTEHPTVPRDSIVAQINVDMVGRGERRDVPDGGPGYLLVIGSRRLSRDLGDLAETVAKDPKHGFTLNYKYDAPGHPGQAYCRSDHYMYARFGIPVAFFTTDIHQDYHQVTDEPQYLSYPKYARVTEYLKDLTVRVADLNHRPLVDQPKPDPNAPCKQ
jgi:peptidase M28-like protein